MGISLTEAYVRTGLTQDATNDVLLTALLDASLATIEHYLDRKMTYDVQRESFYYTHGCNFQLDRYPVEHVTHVSHGANHKVHHLTGTVRFWHNVVGDELEITYGGGYRILPADLELAFWLTFDNLQGAGSGGGANLGGGDVSSITIPDVGTVRFDTGNTISTGTISSGVGLAGEVIPAVALSLLQPYRRLKA